MRGDKVPEVINALLAGAFVLLISQPKGCPCLIHVLDTEVISLNTQPFMGMFGVIEAAV
jgi:hypothetical protein